MVMVAVSYAVIIGLAALCVYLPWLAVINVPNFQVLALFVGGVIVAGSMLWSLVPRPDKFEAPGLILEKSSHPRLFAELDNIAAALGEPMPAEVYLVGETNAWVADRGGFMGIGRRRVMGLGLPLLAALNVSQFRAILAHEFAHYYGGDTRLGPWLHRTQMAMIRTFQNMGSVSVAMRVAIMAILFKVVYGILQWYWLFFLRAINFVSRRQELRADELACMVAGPQALIGGLRVVHGASMAWPAFWREELAPMLNSGRLPPVTSGFSEFLAAPAVAAQVDKGIETQLREGKAEPYDSHPPLRDRIAAAENISGDLQGDDVRPAWSLLEGGCATEEAFYRALNPGLPQDALRPVTWEEQGPNILIPAWTEFVDTHAALLEGMTVGNLFDSLGRTPDIAPRLPDPPGMLLMPEQRLDRARVLVSSALALALSRKGWKVHTGPAALYFTQNDERIDPFQVVRELSNGTLGSHEWIEKCQALHLADVPLQPPPPGPDVAAG